MRLLKSSSIRGGEPEILTRLFRQEKHAPDSITMPPDRTLLSGGRHLRHELKYIINEGTYQYLRSRLLSLMSRTGTAGTADTASPACISTMCIIPDTGRS